MVALSTDVLRWARVTPQKTAIVYGGARISYEELARRTRRLAGLLQADGIRRGDVVALLMKNSAAFIELSLAISHVGAIALPINFRLGAEEVAYILDHAQAKLVFVDEELVASVGAARRIVVDAAAQEDSGALTGPATEAPEPCFVEPADVYRLMYTSGTTDRPKGVVLTYQNYYWKCLDHIAVLGLDAETRLLVVGPLYHVGAFDLPGLAVLITGGMLTVLRDFDAAQALAAIEAERLTGAWLAPVMLSRALALPTRGDYDVSSLQWVVGGGERTPAERIRAFASLFPAGRYIDAYGLTESCSGDTFMEAGWEIAKIGSTGRAVPHVEIAIRDDEGRPLPARQAGEICLRGPKVTGGYWRDPVRTAASFQDGWFRTGDVGFLDEEGFLYLTDRKKDMVISGGENIASSEVERVLYEHPDIEDAAVVGLPDPRWGERVVAVVVPRAGASFDLAALQAHCAGKLGGFKIPKQLVLRTELPRNPSGKILKRVLREELGNAASRDDAQPSRQAALAGSAQVSRPASGEGADREG